MPAGAPRAAAGREPLYFNSFISTENRHSFIS